MGSSQNKQKAVAHKLQAAKPLGQEDDFMKQSAIHGQNNPGTNSVQNQGIVKKPSLKQNEAKNPFQPQNPNSLAGTKKQDHDITYQYSDEEEGGEEEKNPFVGSALVEEGPPSGSYLNWHELKTQEVEFCTLQFKYRFDIRTKRFIVTNDASLVTFSRLSWKWMEEYDVFALTLEDLKTVEISTGKKNLLQPIKYTFDVSADGEFLGIPEIDEIIENHFRVFKLTPQQIADPSTKQNFINLLDGQLRNLWSSVIEIWAPIAEKNFQKGDSEKCAKSSTILENQTYFQQENNASLRKFITEKLTEDPDFIKQLEAHACTRELSEEEMKLLTQKDLQISNEAVSQFPGLMFQSLEKLDKFHVQVLRNDKYHRVAKFQHSKFKELVFNFTQQKKLVVEIEGSSQLSYFMWNRELSTEFSLENIKLERAKFMKGMDQQMADLKHKLSRDRVFKAHRD